MAGPRSITGLRGRTGDATRKPLAVPEYLAAEFMNCDKHTGALAHKRRGSASITMGSVFTGELMALSRYVPAADETAAQFIGADDDGIAARMTAGTTWSAISLKDAIATRPQDLVCCTLNGLHYMAYDSSVARLHVLESGGTHRRVGLATPAAPTAIDSGSGSYGTNPRTYKVAYTVQVSSVTVRRSELSAALSHTPSSGAAGVQVTKPASISESETHWELYGAPTTGDTTYKLLATTVVGTTTFTDTVEPADYSGVAPADAGTYTVPKSYKVIATDGNRLLGLGDWESGGRNSRLEFTALLGQSGTGNHERIPQTDDLNNYIDIDENDGDFGTGIGGPLFGNMYVFKYRSIHELTPTGNANQPYRRVRLASIGCIRQHTIQMGEDGNGDAAMYWLSPKGPYRLGTNGLEYLGWDIEDLWDTANLDATVVTAHTVWHPDKHQWWVWFATTTAPGTLLVFDPREAIFDPEVRAVRGGWFNYSVAGSLVRKANCSCLFANTLGAAMSRDLKPYTGVSDSNNTIYRADDDSATDDAGSAFQAYIETVPRRVHADRYSATADPRLIANAQTGVTLTVTAKGDFGLKADVTGTALLTAAGSETVVSKKIEGLQTAQCEFLAYRIGDSGMAANTWTIHELVLRETAEDTL